MPMSRAAVVANAAICEESNVRSSQSDVTPLSLMVVTETYLLLHSDSSRRHIRGIGLVVGCVNGHHNLFLAFFFGVSSSTYILGARDMYGEKRNA
jgi:hypothetical protein